MRSKLVIVTAMFLLAELLSASAAGEQAANVNAPRDSQRQITFRKRPARIGDQVEQTLALEMRMATTLRQGNQIGEKSRTTAGNKQHRVVTTEHVESDRATAVRVQYVEATKQLAASRAEEQAPPADVPPSPQPVAGKTYFCQRQPGESGKLQITDGSGQIPPPDEYEIVAQHMEMVGRANPLAEFLHGQSISVGQTVELPKDLASRVFNLGEQLGEVTRFALTLQKLEPRDDVMRAVFLAQVEATSSNASQMRLELKGLLAVEVDTCRVVKVDLSGPIAMSEMRGSYSTSYQVIGTGQLKMSVASAYRDAQR